jgi:hypothetical protein
MLAPTSDTRANDLRIVKWVVAAYQAASNLELDLGDSLWETFSNEYFAELAEVFRRVASFRRYPPPSVAIRGMSG